MEDIENFLVVGIGMDGGHKTFIDTKRVIQDFCDRRNAVGGAGSIGDDVMFLRVIFIFVDAQNDSNIFIRGGGGDQNFFSAAL